MATRSLTSQQRQAGQLIGNGTSQTDAAKAVGVSRRSVCAWMKRDDFVAVIRQARNVTLDESPNARSVLEAALMATDRQGHPLWRDRINAARALTGLGGGGKPPEPAAQEIIYADDLLADDDRPGVGINCNGG